LQDTNQILVKFARQNAPKPIDDYCKMEQDPDTLQKDFDLMHINNV